MRIGGLFLPYNLAYKALGSSDEQLLFHVTDVTNIVDSKQYLMGASLSIRRFINMIWR